MSNLIENQKLSPKLFKEELDQLPIRQGFGEGLLKAGEADPRIVGLCADLVGSTSMLPFAKQFPTRYVEVGIGEQNLASVASGLAAMGKIPFMTSYAMFSPGRNWEQVRTTICYNNQNVKLVGSHAGVSVGPDGGTHQAVEDIAIMRVLPRMMVVVPCDSIEARKATLQMAKFVGPVYMRLAREKSAVVTTEESPFTLGKANLLYHGDNPRVGIVACGQPVYHALAVANELAGEGIGVSVLNMHTVKPLDGDALVELAKITGALVVAEEHQRKGGLGGAVAEYLAEHYPVPIEFIGVDDQFGQSGTPEELLKHYGISTVAIKAAANRVIARKK
jgi:transketolase